MGIRSDSGIWQYLSTEIIGSSETVAEALNRLADTVHAQVLGLKGRAKSLEDRATALEARLPNYRQFSISRSGVPNSATQVRQLSIDEIRGAPNSFGYGRQAVNDPGTSTSVPNARLFGLPAGLYSVSFDAQVGQATNARSFIELVPTTGPIARAGIVAGEDRVTLTKTFVQTAAWALEPRLLLQSVSTSSTITGELTIVRLGAVQ